MFLKTLKPASTFKLVSSSGTHLRLTSLAVFPRVSRFTDTVVVSLPVAPADASVSTRLHDAGVLHLGATETRRWCTTIQVKTV